MNNKPVKNDIMAVQQTIKFFENLLDATSDGIIVTDSAQTIIYVNSQFCSFLGRNVRDVKETSLFVWLEQLNHDACQFWSEIEQKLYSKDKLENIEFTANISGKTKYFSISVSLMKQVAEEDKGLLISTWRDITESKRAEEALRDSEEKHRSLFETMAHGIVYQDKGGNIISANPAAERILGLTLDQMQGRTSMDPRWKTIHEDGSDFPGDTHPAMVALKTGKKVRNIIMGVYHPEENEHRWINVNAIPQFKSDEKMPFQVYTTFNDITERRNVEENLKTQKEFTDNVINSLNDTFYIFDPEDGKGLQWNKTLEDISGYNYEKMRHYPPSHFYPPEELPRIEEAMKKVQEKGHATVGLSYIIKDGSHIPFEYSIVPIKDPEGKSLICAVGRDITKRKKIENALKERIKELNGLYGLGALTEKVKDLDELILRFLKEIVPYSMQFPADAIAEIEIDGKKYYNVKGEFKNCLSVPVSTKGKKRGHIKIGYTKDLPLIEEFELKLVNGYAEQIGRIIEYKEAEISLKKAHDNLEKRIKERTKELTESNKQLNNEIVERRRVDTELRESEERFRDFFENAPVGFHIFGQNGIISDINRKELDLLGCTQEEIIGKKKWIDLIIPEQKAIFEKHWKEINETGFVGDYEYTLVTKSGDLIYVLLNASARFAENGNLISTRGSILDITQRKIAEAELKKVTEALQTAERVAKTGGWIWNIKKNKIFCSANYCRIIGFQPEEFDGKLETALSVIHPKDIESVKKNIEDMLVEKKPRIFNYSLKTPDGQEKEIQVSGQITFDENGDVIELEGMIQDITEQKKAEKALQESQQRLSLIYNTVADIIFHLRVEPEDSFRYSSVNQAFLKISGLTIDQIIGKKVEEVIPEPSLTFVLEKYREAISGKKAVTWEETSEYPNGLKTGIITVAPVYNKDGVCIDLIGSIHDITERIEAEKLQAEAVKTSEEAMRFASIGTLAAGITHEINQPLNALTMAVEGILYLEEQKNKLPRKEIIDELGFIAKQSSRIDEIILQMRVLAKQEKGTEPAEFDIHTSINNAISMFKTRLKNHSIEIMTGFKKNLPAITGNSMLFEQVIANIALNAMNALDSVIRKNKTLVIRTGKISGYVVIEIIDNGPGFQEEYLSKVFDPFFTTSIKEGGTGLGMSISKRIITEHHGTISAQNIKEGGAKITIQIPFKK